MCSQKRQGPSPSQHEAKQQRQSESRDHTPSDAQTSAPPVHGSQHLDSIPEIEGDPFDFDIDSYPSDNVRGASEWLGALSKGGPGDFDIGLDGCEDGEEFDINVLSDSSDNQLDGDSDETEDEVTSFLNAPQRHKPTVPCVPTKQKQQCRSGMPAMPAYDPLNCCKSFHRPSSYTLYWCCESKCGFGSEQ